MKAILGMLNESRTMLICCLLMLITYWMAGGEDDPLASFTPGLSALGLGVLYVAQRLDDLRTKREAKEEAEEEAKEEAKEGAKAETEQEKADAG